MGLYAAKWTNANSYHNIQFISNGGASYWFDGASENTIVGGFTGGEFPVRSLIFVSLVLFYKAERRRISTRATRGQQDPSHSTSRTGTRAFVR